MVKYSVLSNYISAKPAAILTERNMHILLIPEGIDICFREGILPPFSLYFK
jgi:hypothetical protein